MTDVQIIDQLRGEIDAKQLEIAKLKSMLETERADNVLLRRNMARMAKRFGERT